MVFHFQAQKAAEKKQRPVSTSSSKDGGGKRSQPQTPQRKLSPAPQPILKKSPSGGAIGMTLMGPAAPGIKLRDNPAMAKTLAHSLPPGSGVAYQLIQLFLKSRGEKYAMCKLIVMGRVA